MLNPRSLLTDAHGQNLAQTSCRIFGDREPQIATGLDDLPDADFRNPADRPAQDRVDILRAFGEACRDDLQRYTRRGLAA